MTRQLVALITLVLMHIICFAVMTERKYSAKTTILLYAGLFVFFILVSLFVSRVALDIYSPYTTPVIYISTIAVSFIVFMLTSTDPTSKKLFLFFSYASVFCIIFCTAAMISSIWFDDELGAAAIYTKTTLRTLLYVPVIWIYIAFLRPAMRAVSGSNKRIWHSIALVSLLFLGVFSVFCLIYSQNNDFREWHSILFAATVLIYVAVYGVIFGTIRYMTEESRMELVEKNMQYLQSQLEAAEENELAARTIRHDFRHHNQNLAAMLRKGETEEALRYIEQYDESLDAAGPLRFCPHVTVNAILTSFYTRAQSEGLRVSIEADTPEESAVRDMDYVAILSNLLENAVNGCLECGAHGDITVSLRSVAGKTVIVCSNPCSPALAIENGLLTKKGIGMESMLTAARKYDGDISYSIENGILTVCVILKS